MMVLMNIERFDEQNLHVESLDSTLSSIDLRDVDNSWKPGKLPGCERDFSGCEALLLSPKCF